MNRNPLKKSLLAAASVAMVLGSVAPASAGGPHYRHGYRPPPPPHYYYGSRHYRHYHHGLSAGEAALLSVGILGGIVLIDRALEADRTSYAYGSGGYYAPPPPSGDLYYRRDDRYAGYAAPAAPPPPQDYDDDLDRSLDGGPGEPASTRYNYGAAYNDCKAETRAAASDGGYMIALPAKPESIEEIDGGAAVRFRTSFLASNRSGEWRRTMVCEADEGGVRFLQLT